MILFTGETSYEVELDENILITMRDGIRIAVDVHRPKAQDKFPALLSMSPYGKEKQRYPESVIGIFTKVEAGDTKYFVSKGYVHVIADVRGSSPSEGQWNVLDKKEQQDGYELIEWIAKQPWCNGKVAMVGESYFAAIQYLVAATQPPSLVTIVPCDGFTDAYRDWIYQGGMYNAGQLGYFIPSTYETCLPQGERPSKKWQPPAPIILDTILRPTDGSYYWERSSYTKFDKITVPIYHMTSAGHFVHYRGQLNAYMAINKPKKLLIGAAPPFEMFHSPALSQQIVRWLDYWLKGIDTGIMNEPPVAVYLTGSDEWRYEFEYPLARTEWTSWYLHRGSGNGASKPPYGLLNVDRPTEEEAGDSYDYPESQRSVASNQPVLAYLTSPLDRDMEIIGPASLILYAASTADDMNWVIKIDDQAPDGSIAVVTKGWLKASHREIDPAKSKPGQPFHTHSNPTRIEPNKTYKYEIELWPIFHTFRAGHRLRLRIASGDSFIWDVMNAHNALFQPGRNTIFHNMACPSHLILPIIPSGTGKIEPRPAIDYKPPSRNR
ncbi:MAG: CocE/NonD family hydrolase [Chloroflexota bacterium]